MSLSPFAFRTDTDPPHRIALHADGNEQRGKDNAVLMLTLSLTGMTRCPLAPMISDNGGDIIG